MHPTIQHLKALPKIELHVHLEGTISADTAIALARRHGEDPEQALPLVDGRFPERFDGFMGFLAMYQAVSRLLRTPADLELVAAAFARQQAEQNVLYSEATFTAVTHVRNGMDARDMWSALRNGFDSVPQIEIALIVDAVRDLGAEHAEDTIRLVEEADAPIAGLGLSGIEGSRPEREFVMLREAADGLGLGFAVHAGETGYATNVAAALDDLGADRIGHGIAAVDAPDLVSRLVRDAVPLEVCPSSNVVVGVVPGMDAHPFPRLWEAGANVTVNSDDPPFFATTLTDELAHVVELAGLTVTDVGELQRRAIRAAFTSGVTKARLIRAVDEWELRASGH